MPTRARTLERARRQSEFRDGLFCVDVVIHKNRTSERATAQIEFRYVVAELADVARQREARLVAAERNCAPLGFHAD